MYNLRRNFTGTANNVCNVYPCVQLCVSCIPSHLFLSFLSCHAFLPPTLCESFCQHTHTYTHTHTHTHTYKHAQLTEVVTLSYTKLLALAPTIMFIHLSQERKDTPSASS